jgi:hypothetical protein
VIRCVTVKAYAVTRVCDHCGRLGPFDVLLHEPVVVDPTKFTHGPDSIAAKAGWLVSTEQDVCQICREFESPREIADGEPIT